MFLYLDQDMDLCLNVDMDFDLNKDMFLEEWNWTLAVPGHWNVTAPGPNNGNLHESLYISQDLTFVLFVSNILLKAKKKKLGLLRNLYV